MTIFKLIGIIGFYLLWPFWFAYFKLYPNRTRALIVFNGQIVLIKGWLGKNEWGLPGGGVKNGESLEVGLKREIKEEIGLTLDSNKFTKIGVKKNSNLKLNYLGHFYEYNLDNKANLSPGFPEIIDAKWVKIDEISKFRISDEVQFSLKKHTSSKKS